MSKMKQKFTMCEAVEALGRAMPSDRKYKRYINKLLVTAEAVDSFKGREFTFEQLCMKVCRLTGVDPKTHMTRVENMVAEDMPVLEQLGLHVDLAN